MFIIYYVYFKNPSFLEKLSKWLTRIKGGQALLFAMHKCGNIKKTVSSIEYTVYSEEEIKFKIRLSRFLRKFAMTEGGEVIIMAYAIRLYWREKKY